MLLQAMVCSRLPASTAGHLNAVCGCVQAHDLLTFHDEHGAAALEARDAPQLTWEQVRWRRADVDVLA